MQAWVVYSVREGKPRLEGGQEGTKQWRWAGRGYMGAGERGSKRCQGVP